MSTDIEQRVRASLASAPHPAGLRLDADAVTRVASRSHRRRRTGQALVAGMASLAVLGPVAWAGGWLPGEVQRALPASPWSWCPISGSLSGERAIQLADLEHVAIPLRDGSTVVAGLAQGCPEGDLLLMSATPEPADALPATVPVQGALGNDVDPHMEELSSWWSGLQLPDGRRVTGVMLPHGATDLVRVGPDSVEAPSTSPVRVPGTNLDAVVFEDSWPDGEDLAQVWRGTDGLVHTSWSAGITSRVWQGNDPAARITDTWVGQDRQEQQWVMRDGKVNGPFPVSAEPYAVAFPTDTTDGVEVVVVLPKDIGELRLQDGTTLTTLWLDAQEGEPTLHAALVTLASLTPDEPLPDLAWVTDTDTDPRPVPVIQP